MKKEQLYGLLLVLLIAVLVVAAPLISIWALNTLFSLSIPYTFWTWLAMVWVNIVTFGKFKQESN